MSLDKRVARRIGATLAGLALTAAAAPAAFASTHDYCNWDGSYCANAAYTLYGAPIAAFLTDNHATLVYHPTIPTIYCGAYSGGVQYAGFTSGNPSCDHAYSGANQLQAMEYVDSAATTHGTITY